MASAYLILISYEFKSQLEAQRRVRTPPGVCIERFQGIRGDLMKMCCLVKYRFYNY